ncbi:hypothetical protein BD779DRAFT_1791329 [Infundibulicybe gibba]|nr:hypothetical protein BD779DRAFT_1791329 [Infundibulicybe gibba]
MQTSPELFLTGRALSMIDTQAGLKNARNLLVLTAAEKLTLSQPVPNNLRLASIPQDRKITGNSRHVPANFTIQIKAAKPGDVWYPEDRLRVTLTRAMFLPCRFSRWASSISSSGARYFLLMYKRVVTGAILRAHRINIMHSQSTEIVVILSPRSIMQPLEFFHPLPLRLFGTTAMNFWPVVWYCLLFDPTGMLFNIVLVPERGPRRSMSVLHEL